VGVRPGARGAGRPFEKVRIKVVYPRFGERQNTLVLERWIPWEQVYGSPEQQAEGSEGNEGAPSE
jgi:hypothetical protein